MKQSLLCLLALFSVVSVEQVRAVQIKNEFIQDAQDIQMEANKMPVEDKPKQSKMIEIELDKTEYESGRFPQSQDGMGHSLVQSFAQSTGMSSEEILKKYQSTGITKGMQDIDMINMKNMAYEGTFWFGKPSQKMDVIFDTGSAWAWLFSEKCKDGNCPAKNKKYEQSKSPNYKVNEDGGQMLAYGKGMIMGHPSQDRACFGPDESHCVEKMNFLSVVKSKDLSSLKGSGLIGLAPTPAKQQEFDDPMHNGIPGFVQQMKKSSQYQEEFDPMFSIYLSNTEAEKGKITFGGYNLAKYGKEGTSDKDIFWSDLAANENYWSINTKGVNFGQKSLSNKDQTAVLDNGMSFAMAPTKSFAELVKNLEESYGIHCEQMQPVWACECKPEQYEKLPDLEFTLLQNTNGDTHTVKMPKTSYMYKHHKEPVSFLMITPWEFAGIGGNKDDEVWVLGDQFLHNYYSIYNFDTKKIGLVESVTSVIGKKDAASPHTAVVRMVA